MTRILVNGAGGFIGGHLVKRLKTEGFWVRPVDLEPHDFAPLPPMSSSSATSATQPSSAPSSRASMRSTNWRPIWAEPDMSSPGSTTPPSCTTPPPSTSTAWSVWPLGRREEVLLFLLRLHVPRVQPARSEQPEVLPVVILRFP